MSIKGNAESFKELRCSLYIPEVIHGKSAYEIAVMNGFDGTETEWLASLKGDTYNLTDDDKKEIASDIVGEYEVEVNEAVNTWLEDHPEATTTVQDGALTEGKFSDGLKLRAIKDYVTPAMFGAVGDGVTDDTASVQAAVESALYNRIALLIDKAYRITSINITNRYLTGIKIIGATRSHQLANNEHRAKLIVYGDDSVGLDISGTEGLTFENLCIMGDETVPPKCLLYASRTTANRQCPGHIIRDCRFGGNVTKAYIYNYAGEMWTMYSTKITISKESSALYGFYGTSINSLGVTSPFATLDSTVTPLTCTSFKSCSFSAANNAVTVYFESGYLADYSGKDITIAQINIDNCYTHNPLNSSYRFDDVSGGVAFISCTDESGATDQSQREPAIIYCGGRNLLTSFDMIGCMIYGKTDTPFLKVDCPMINYNATVRTINRGMWVFTNNFQHAKHGCLRDGERFQTGYVKDIEIVCDSGDPAKSSNIVLNNGVTFPNHSYIEREITPNGYINASPGSICYATSTSTHYISYGWDIWSWRTL